MGPLQVIWLPPTDMHVVRLIGETKLTLGVDVGVSVCVSSVIDWQPVKGVPHLSPYDSWDRLQPPKAVRILSPIMLF